MSNEQLSTDESKSAPKTADCKGCGKLIEVSDWTCPHCGYTRWGSIASLLVFSISCIFAGVLGFFSLQSAFWHNVVAWAGGGLGLLTLTLAISEVLKGLRADKLYRNITQREPQTFQEMAPDIIHRINHGLGLPVSPIAGVQLRDEGIGKRSLSYMFANGSWQETDAGAARTPREYADIVVKHIHNSLLINNALKSLFKR